METCTFSWTGLKCPLSWRLCPGVPWEDLFSQGFEGHESHGSHAYIGCICPKHKTEHGTASDDVGPSDVHSAYMGQGLSEHGRREGHAALCPANGDEATHIFDTANGIWMLPDRQKSNKVSQEKRDESKISKTKVALISKELRAKQSEAEKHEEEGSAKIQGEAGEKAAGDEAEVVTSKHGNSQEHYTSSNHFRCSGPGPGSGRSKLQRSPSVSAGVASRLRSSMLETRTRIQVVEEQTRGPMAAMPPQPPSAVNVSPKNMMENMLKMKKVSQEQRSISA